MEDRYIVSARKYRPVTFASVVGQGTLTGTLRNAIMSDRVAQAYLFCGPRGVGKTSCARIFAKTLNCEHRTADGEACGECASCKDFQRGTSYNVVELDAASNNGINEMKGLIEQVNVPPQTGKYRVFIIDEVHMLSTQAFNAFLKTLEEPPRYAVFVLATTEKNKVLPTILSRCQIYDFSRITDSDISAHLGYVASQEGIGVDALALDVISRKADGAMRDALSIFDQVAAASGGNITYEGVLKNLNMLDYEYYFRFVDAFRSGSVTDALLLYKEVRDKGFDAQYFINGLAVHIRNLMVAFAPATFGLLEVADKLRERYLEQARMQDARWYYGALKILSEADLNYRVATDKLLLVELALIRLCQLGGGGDTPTGSDTPRLQGMKGGAVGASGGGNAAAASSVPVSSAATTAAPPVSPAAASPAAQHSGDRDMSPRAAAGRGGAPRPRRGVASVRLSSAFNPENKSDDADGGGAGGGRAEPVTAHGLERAWRAFAAAHSSERILNQAMLVLPVAVGDGEYLLVVDHPGLAREVEAKAGEICAFMRDQLKNDAFTLKVDVRETQHTHKLQPRELLQQMVEGNSDMRSFVEGLGLEIE